MGIVVNDHEFKHDDAVNLQFSPKTDQVFYIATQKMEDGQKEFIAVEGKTLTPLHDHIVKFNLNPIDEKLAYIAKENEKFFVVIDGVAGKNYVAVDDFQWSRNGKHFAYVAKEKETQKIVVDEKEGPTFGYIDEFQFSPDSSSFAYRAKQEDKTFIAINGNLFGPYDEASHASFSPENGSSYAYSARIGPKTFLFKNGKEIGVFADLNGFSFLPDGSLIWIASENGKTKLFKDGLLLQEGEEIGSFRIAEKHINPESLTVLKPYGEGNLPDIEIRSFTAFVPQESYYLQMNRTTIFRYSDITGGGPGIIFEKEDGYGNLIFLGDVYRGDGCPVDQILIRISSLKDYEVSDIFGTCQEPKTQWKGNRLILKFPSREYLGYHYPAEKWVYENKKLRQVR